DVRAERVQRNAAFAIPLGAGDFRAVQSAGDAHLDAERADAHRVRHGALHRAAEHHAALELLRDAFGDQLRVELGLADLGDVDAHVGDRHLHHLRDLATQLLDVLALLADHDARTRRVDRDVDLARRALDLDAADRGFDQALLQERTHQVIGVDVRREILGRRIPLRRPVAGDTETNANRIDFLAHKLLALPVADGHDDVAVALDDAIAAPLGARMEALQQWRRIDRDRLHLQLVHVRAQVVL